MPVPRTAAPLTVVPEDALLSAREAWALVGSQPLAQLSNMALLPSLGAMRADLNLSYGELGIVVASFGFARLLMDLPAGGLARRWNPRTVLLSAFAISTVASAVGIAAANAWQIATVRFCIGIASSAAQAMILAWLVGGAGRAARGRVMARSEAFFSVAGLLIPSLGGLLAEPLGWRVAFLLGAIAAALGFLAVLFLTRPTSAARSVGLEPPHSTSSSAISPDPRRTRESPAAPAGPPLADSSVPIAPDHPQTPAVAQAPNPGSSRSADVGSPRPNPSLEFQLPSPASAAPVPPPNPPRRLPNPSRRLPNPSRRLPNPSRRLPNPSRRLPSPSRRLPSLVLASVWSDLRLGGRVLLSAYIVTFVVFFSRNGLLNAVLPVMGTDRFGIRPAEIGVLFSTMNALSIGVVLLGGRAGDRFGRAKMLAPGLAILLACQIALFVVQDSITYIAIGLVQALSFFVNPLPPSLLGDALPPRARPQAIGVYRAVSDLALLAAPAIMGASLQLGGFPAAELASVAVIALSLLAVLVISTPRR